MNVFTKEELNKLYALALMHDKETISFLRKKLLSMIENYCDHKNHRGEIEIFTDICGNCDCLLLRNKTLREQNQ